MCIVGARVYTLFTRVQSVDSAQTQRLHVDWSKTHLLDLGDHFDEQSLVISARLDFIGNGCIHERPDRLHQRGCDNHRKQHEPPA